MPARSCSALLTFDPAQALRGLDAPACCCRAAADRQVVPMEDIQPLIDALGKRSKPGEAVVVPGGQPQSQAVSLAGRSGLRRTDRACRRRPSSSSWLVLGAGRLIGAPSGSIIARKERRKRHGGDGAAAERRRSARRCSGVDLQAAERGRLRARSSAPGTEHSVILLRGQQLGDDDLLAFSRRFGELDPPPNQERGRISPPGYPDIYVVSNVLDDNGDPIGALGAGEAVWHTDMSYLDTPPDASMLYSLEIPPSGGNTWFCGMQAALRRAAGRAAAPHRAAGASSTTAPTIPAATCARA